MWPDAAHCYFLVAVPAPMWSYKLASDYTSFAWRSSSANSLVLKFQLNARQFAGATQNNFLAYLIFTGINRVGGETFGEG